MGITQDIKALQNEVSSLRQETRALRQRMTQDWDAVIGIITRPPGHVVLADGRYIAPENTGQCNLGTSDLHFGTVYADNFSGGSASVADAIVDQDGGADIEAARSATANTLLALNGSAQFPDSVIPSTIARDSEIATAISDHEAAADPHPGYLTPAEHTAIGDSSPHHAAVTEGNGIAVSGQQVSVDLHGTWSGLKFDGGDLLVDLSKNFTWDGTHTFATQVEMQGGVRVYDNQALYFGNDDDACIQYDETVNNRVDVSGAEWYFYPAVTVAGAFSGLSTGEFTGLLTGSAGALFTGNVDITSGGDFTVGTNIFFVDASGTNVGINCTPDAQFDLDVAGNIRAQGWIVGKHAIQLDGAVMICHFDGPEPFNTDFTGNPTGHMGQVATVTGGVIYRPGQLGKAVQIADATTNLCTNPSGETGTTGWASAWGDTISRDTNDSVYGDYEMNLTAGGGAGCATFFAITPSASTDYVFSVWIKADSSVTGTIRLQVWDQAWGDVSSIDDNGNHPKDGEWHRLWTLVNSGSATSLCFAIRGWTMTTGQTIYFDGAQIEQRSEVSPYCDGSLGDGHSWSGTEHASTSSRESADILYPYGTVAGVDKDAWTLMFWIYSDCGFNHRVSVSSNILSLVSSGSNYIRIYAHQTDGADDTLRFLWRYGGSNSHTDLTTIATEAGSWHHIAVTYDGTNLKSYVNGVADKDIARTSWDEGANPTRLDVGDAETQPHPGLLFDDLVILDRVADADEIRAVYESNAPVFAETSTWHWRSASNLVWADAEGLWGRDEDGNAGLGWSGVDSKSWGGATLDKGDFLLGQKAASKSWMMWDASTGALDIGVSSAERISLTGAGVLTIKDSGGAAVFTFDASSGAEFTKPLTIATTGGIYQGSGTFSSPTTGLKLWNDGGYGRIAGYNSGVVQWYADTAGNLVAGGGYLVLNEDGISIEAPTTIRDDRAYTFNDGSDVVGGLYEWITTNITWVSLRSNASSYYASMTEIKAYGGYLDNIVYLSVGDGTTYAELVDSEESFNVVAADVRIARGLYVGSTSIDPDANDIHYDGNLKSVKSSTTYDVYAFHPLTTPLTHSSFNGTSYSTVSTPTIIQNTGWSSTIPANAKALLLAVEVRDSAALGTTGLYFIIGPNSSYDYALQARPIGGDIYVSNTGVVPCVNGDVYYRVSASGSNTLDIYLRCWGYWI